ncbi:DNA recombination protein RmuC [Arenimonas composti]|uniref:DNA recombination protein RmuC n=1 Tax=Arenimonas composti TR7-09 = DSM 18010 TaxID=1121013 RepID=A0A091BDT2_9GAMM|nr:DNA recombination protein RmuC [Arenimonas composti]KFN48939.1 hypothetical protein P873_01165 [Arenimonas composti TR7-09 = DSM 18010]
MPTLSLLSALLIAVLAAVAGFWLGAARASSRARAELARMREALDAAGAEAARLPELQARAQRAEAEAATLRNRLEAALAAGAAAEAARDGAERQREAGAAALEAERRRLEAIAGELAQARAQLAEARARLEAGEAAHAQTRAFLDEARVQLRTAFTEAASKVFDEKAIALDERIRASGLLSREGLEQTLKPFAERVAAFQQRIDAFAETQVRDRASFTGSIESLQKLNQDMADATRALERALKGNAKARGDWGEMILESVLKASGLVEGTNYTRQSGTVDDESGKRLVPDVIVNLPDGRRVVVDAKLNLIAWAEATNAETPEAHDEALYRHAAALRQHVRDLAERNYPKSTGADTLDLTVMFVPIEGALAAALATNPDLQSEALDRKIVFASPNTLMAMLRVVERLWVRDRLQRQVESIGAEAGKVLDSLIAFEVEFRAIESKLAEANRAFNTARQRLTESPQSVFKRAQRLVEAGARGKRALPESLKPEDGVETLPLDGSGLVGDEGLAASEAGDEGAG